MRPVGVVLLAILGGALLPAADPLGTEAVAAGPWWVVAPEGGYRVGFLLVPPVDAAQVRAQPVRADGAPVAATVDMAPVVRSQEQQTGLVAAVWHVPAARSLTIGARTLTPPPMPRSGQAVRLAVASVRNYPERADLERLAPTLGGPVDGVLLLGPGLERRIATADWETSLPLLIAPPVRPDPAVVALTGLPTLTWTIGIGWGPLGIAVARPDEEPALTIGRHDQPWRILCDPADRWDLGLQSSPARRDPTAFRSFLAQTARSNVPLVLAGGSPSGFLSEPLDTDAKGRLAPRAGGTRYVQVAATGDACVNLPPAVSLPLDTPALLGLTATTRFLTLAIQPRQGDDAALKYTWVDAREDGVAKAGPGWGFGQGRELLEQWRAARSAAEPDLRQIEALCLEALQLPRAELATGDWSLPELFLLGEKDGERTPGPAARALARRLVADVDFLGEEWGLLAKLPLGLRRDALLRWFAHAGTEELRWRRLAARSPDPMIVRALLSQVERQPDSPLLGILVERLGAQATEEIPLDEDPMIQARITTLVFGSAIVSPTPLRPIARSLESRVAPVAKPPIERFLALRGRFRPVPPEAYPPKPEVPVEAAAPAHGH